MFVWKHVFHVFFVSFVIIILANCTDLCATEPLFGRFMIKLIVSLEGLIFSDRSTPLVEIIFSFQVPQDQMILTPLDIYWAINFC